MQVDIIQSATSNLRTGEVHKDVKNRKASIWLHGHPASLYLDIADAIALRDELARLIPEAERITAEIEAEETTPAADRIERMADAMIAIAAERGHCLDLDLIERGYTADEIHLHAAKARTRAAELSQGRAA